MESKKTFDNNLIFWDALIYQRASSQNKQYSVCPHWECPAFSSVSFLYWRRTEMNKVFFFFLIIPGTLWMVSEFPFHKQRFPWQEQPAKSFECYWDIFEWGSREQPAATSLLTEAWTSINPDKCNGIKPQFICTALWKKRRIKKSPLGLKTHYALNRCTLPQNTLWFSYGNKSFPQRENTAFFKSAVIIRQKPRLVYWMFSSLAHTEKHEELIRPPSF